ncbi:MAG: 4-hydroxythreonine-4-phosphate dehydrogenase PdxA, partial [Flavobacteriales bacterium]|nr:4-hydroxythreonine-4-phosphate dehydrogenase PdxA [Flavobacteriales bacterium]
MSETRTMKVGISCGDLNGVGLEVVLKAFEDNRMMQDITPVLYCGVKAVSHHRKALKLEEVQFHGVKSVNDVIPRKFNVVDL